MKLVNTRTWAHQPPRGALFRIGGDYYTCVFRFYPWAILRRGIIE